MPYDDVMQIREEGCRLVALCGRKKHCGPERSTLSVVHGFLEGLTKRWTWTWTSLMLNGGLQPVDLLSFSGWKPVTKQWTLNVDAKNLCY